MRPRSSSSSSITAPVVYRGALVSLLFTVLACNAGDRPVTAVAVADSAGIRIITVAPSVDLPTWTVDSVPRVEIGGRAEDPAHQLFRVRSAARLHDGTIVLSNTGTNEIRLFDTAGKYVRTLGRAGKGPGEFQWLATVLVAGTDSIIAFDRSAQRATVFAAAGSVLGTIPLPATRAAAVGRLSDGTFFPTQFLSGMPRRPRGVRQDTAPIIRYGPTGSQDTVAVVVVLEWFSHGDDRPPTPMPYGRTTYVASAIDGLMLVDSRELAIRRYSLDGRLLSIVRIDRPPMRLTDSAWQRAHDQWISNASGSAVAQYEERWRDLPRPALLPMSYGILSDAEGNVWLREFLNDGDALWWVFSAAGEPVARVRVPREITILTASRESVLGRRESDTVGERVGLFTVR